MPKFLTLEQGAAYAFRLNYRNKITVWLVSLQISTIRYCSRLPHKVQFASLRLCLNFTKTKLRPTTWTVKKWRCNFKETWNFGCEPNWTIELCSDKFLPVFRSGAGWKKILVQKKVFQLNPFKTAAYSCLKSDKLLFCHGIFSTRWRIRAPLCSRKWSR